MDLLQRSDDGLIELVWEVRTNGLRRQYLSPEDCYAYYQDLKTRPQMHDSLLLVVYLPLGELLFRVSGGWQRVDWGSIPQKERGLLGLVLLLVGSSIDLEDPRYGQAIGIDPRTETPQAELIQGYRHRLDRWLRAHNLAGC